MDFDSKLPGANFDKVKFHPYFTRKDLFGFFGMLAFLVGLCLVAP